ncbi:nitroreductase family protein [uncultured Sunxiuqinia sp.]|uniref:nitroreductase family protein n=1 Tax=uncultured Sunxiuqinia sp. TaxID=1573825 RepID=UPI002619A943|nr:nitroreductase family protein [uncultured Sunxiuqinia sp.]
MELLFQHRSIRQYKSTPVADDLLNQIIEAGTRASNTGNMQLYSVVVTRDEEKKAQLAPLHFNQPMVKQAPVLLTICADINLFNHWCKQRKADAGYNNLLWLMNSTIDASLFAQNLCVEAESHGLGICYLGTALYNAQEFIDALELPKGVIPVTAIVLGYPDQEPPLTDRLPLNAVVHHEKYVDFKDEQVNELFSEKENLPSSRQFVSENKKENLAQVFTDIRYKKQDAEAFSAKLMDTLRKQGFEL